MLLWEVKKNFRQTVPQEVDSIFWSVGVETIKPLESAQELLIELEKIYKAIVEYVNELSDNEKR